MGTTPSDRVEGAVRTPARRSTAASASGKGPISLARSAVRAGAAIGLAVDDRQIYQAVCDAVIADTGIDMAWIGLLEPVHRTLRLHASAGGGEDLARLARGARYVPECPGCFIKTALVSGTAATVGDVDKAPDDAEARALAGQGVKSMLAVPLQTDHVVLGALMCYSSSPDFFGPEAVEILTLLASQATSRLSALETESAHREAQYALAESEQRYRGLFESAPLGIMVIRRGEIEVNDAVLAMFGYADHRELEAAGLMSILTPESRAQVEAFVATLAPGDPTPAIFQATGLRRDGSTLPLLIEGTQMQVDGGNAAIVFLTDLGPMEAAEGVAQVARGQYRSLVKSSPLPIMSLDLEGTVRSWNPAAEEVFGWSASEAVGRAFPGGLTASDHAHLRRAASGEEPAKPHETRLTRRDGSPVDLRLWASPNRRPNGETAGVLVIAEDVTEQLAEKAALELMRRRIQYLFANMQEGMAYQRMVYTGGQASDFVFLATNAAFETHTGLHDVVGKTASEAMPGFVENEVELMAMFARIAAGGPPETMTRYVAPIQKWMCVSAFCPEPGYFGTLFDDVTERVRGEKALEGMNALLEKTEALGKIGSWRLDLATGQFIRSKEVTTLLGGDDSNDLAGAMQTLGRLVHPEDREMAAQLFGRAVQGEALTAEFRIALADGSLAWIHAEAEPELDAAGRPVAVTGFVQDITARVESARELSEKQALLDSVVNAAPEFIYAKDLQGRYVVANRQVGAEVGKTVAEVIGHTDAEIFSAERARQFEASDRSVLDSGEVVVSDEHFVEPTGVEHWYITTKGPLHDAEGKVAGIFGVSREVTERRRAEQITAARARLLAYSFDHSLAELLAQTLNEAEDLTGSQIGFFHLVDEDEAVLHRVAWSDRTRATCNVESVSTEAGFDQAGVWLECIRLRKPVIHNAPDSMPERKGMPEGHVAVAREVSIPLFRAGKIKAVIGVGNKPTNYVQEDVDAIAQLADLAFDVAERLRAEEELRRELTVHSALLEHAPVAIGAQRQGRGLFANDAHRKLFGYSNPDELRSLGPADMIAPEALPLAEERRRRRELGEEVPAEYETVGLRRDGTTFPMLLHAERVDLPDGPATIMFHLDLTDLKKTSEALQLSEAKFSTAFDSAPMVIALSDLATGRFLDLNREALAFAGFSREEAIGRTPVELGWMSADQLAATTEEMRRSGRIEGKEITRHKRNGDVVEMLFYGNVLPIEGGEYMLSILVDITERKKLDRELGEARAVQEDIVDSTSDWIWSVDPVRFGYLSFNRSHAKYVERTRGFPPHIGMTPDELFEDRKFRDQWVGFYRRALAEGAFQVEYDASLGDERLLMSFHLIEAGGKVAGISVFGRDITEARKAALALEASEERFRAISESSLSGISMVESGRYTYVNPALAAIFGYERDDLIGVDPLDLIYPPDLAIAREALRRRAEGEIGSLIYECRGLRKDGRVVQLVIFGSRFELEGRTVLMGNVLDVTDRTRLEEELRQSQKMEAVGRLAGGVAHDFNNLLTAIGGYARLLEDDLRTGAGDPEDAVQIRQAADRAAALTSRLLTFSGRRRMEPAPITLDRALEGILPILRRLVPERIEVGTRLDPTPLVLAEAADLDQVLMNLVVNAADAIAGHGRIEIATGAVEHDAEFVHSHAGSKIGPHARLTIADTGSGMDQATQARIFEPFFTTKPIGQGTGLGLSTVYGVVGRLGGAISVRSTPGSGTVFEIDLPAAEPGAQSEILPEDRITPAGTDGILVVEDDPGVRDFALAALRRLGYRITAVATPDAALELDLAAFDMVLTDVVMPGINGRELLRRLRQKRPGLKGLLMSGYEPEDSNAETEAPDAPLLRKPFSQAEIARAVRNVLDEGNLDSGN